MKFSNPTSDRQPSPEQLRRCSDLAKRIYDAVDSGDDLEVVMNALQFAIAILLSSPALTDEMRSDLLKSFQQEIPTTLARSNWLAAIHRAERDGLH